MKRRSGDIIIAAAAAAIFLVALSVADAFLVVPRQQRQLQPRHSSASPSPFASTAAMMRPATSLFESTKGTAEADSAEDAMTPNDEERRNKKDEDEDEVTRRRLKSELMELAGRTDRGFAASPDDKGRANAIVESLKLLQVASEPAKPYYNNNGGADTQPGSAAEGGPSLSGKWTLVYTDAPDITGLDTSRNPFVLSTAKLGRIGQECSPPYIKNVIEWTRPGWAASLPLSGSGDDRVLQKVVTTGQAKPSEPRTVDLKIAGLELEAGPGEAAGDTGSDSDSNNPLETLQRRGLPAGLLALGGPVDIKGPLDPLPFGRFEIMYLDEDLRAIRTGQNYLAVNERITSRDDEWF